MNYFNFLWRKGCRENGDFEEKLDSLENSNDQTEITLRGELFKIEKDLPPVDVMFLYDVINKFENYLTGQNRLDTESLIASR